MYSDGTVFYLDRTAAENEHTRRAALGPYVWRKADRTDALYRDCVGASTYKKAQGLPVRIWGLLAEGVLHIYVLDAGEVMNQDLYAQLIEEYFPRWMGSASYLVQDFEPCLRAGESIAAMESIGVELVEDYPRSSQDFNAIENAWALLKGRLADTLPKGVEGRDAFISRLHKAVSWVNKNNREELWRFSTNQKERASDCLNAEPAGSRTKW